MTTAVLPICLLASVCLFDLGSTCLLLHYGGAEEANPLMSVFLKQGLPGFIGAKLAFVLVPIGFFQWACRHKRCFVLRAVRLGTAAYVSIYLVGVARANIVNPPSDSALDKSLRQAWAITQTRLEARSTVRRSTLSRVQNSASRTGEPAGKAKLDWRGRNSVRGATVHTETRRQPSAKFPKRNRRFRLRRSRTVVASVWGRARVGGKARSTTRELA